MNVLDKSITDLEPNELNCMPNALDKYSFELEGKSDLKIRAIEWVKRRRDTARVVWLVLNRVEDIASFQLAIENQQKVIISNSTIDYHLREFVAKNLDENKNYKICIIANDSKGNPRPTFKSQCVQFNGNSNHFVRYNFQPRNKVTKSNLKIEPISSSSSSSQVKFNVISFSFFIVLMKFFNFL